MDEISEKFVDQANQAAAVANTFADDPNGKTPGQYAYAQVALLALLVQTVATVGLTVAALVTIARKILAELYPMPEFKTPDLAA